MNVLGALVYLLDEAEKLAICLLVVVLLAVGIYLWRKP